MNRIYLSVEYTEKSAAKAAGARWDDESRSWYYPTREPVGSEALAVLPVALHKFVPAQAEIVRNPETVRKERTEKMRACLCEAFEVRLPEIHEKIEAAPLEQYRPVWATAQDAVTIRSAFLHAFAETGKTRILDRISGAEVFYNEDVDKVLENILYVVVTELLEAAQKSRWDAVTKPLIEGYFDCLDSLDLDRLPHGDIQSGDKHVQGDLEIEFGHSNLLPMISSISHRGVLIFHHREKNQIKYGGKFVHHADFHPKLREVNRKLVERHLLAVKEVLADVVVAADAKRAVNGENFTIQTADGRVITGFMADGEFYIHNLDGKPLGEAPEKDALCERIRQVFNQA